MVEMTRCRSMAATGYLCRRATNHGYMCIQHLEQECHLAVRKSTIPGAGWGLFTTIDRCKGERIVAYEGRRIDGHISGQYVLQLGSNCCIDASEPSSGVGRYVNCCRTQNKASGACTGNNTRFVINRKNQTASIVAIKSIAADTEIFCGYGRAYW
jgi:hypothetical protein